MGMMETMGVTPVYEVNGGHEKSSGGFGDNWVLFLFFLLAWGGFGNGGGLFGGRGAEGAGAQMISNDFMYSNLNNALNQGFAGISAQNQGIGKDMLTGFSTLGYQNQQQTFDISNVIAQVGRDLASCCCETNRNIDALRYEGAKNTCDIISAGNLNTRDLIANQTANTQAILDRLTNQEVQALRDKLTSYEIQLSNQAQTASIVSQVRPYPVPSYPVCPPFPPFPPVAPTV